MKTLAIILVTFVLTLGLVLLGFVAVAETGAVNVAATQEHLPGVYWFLETLQESSIEQQASGLQTPPLDDPQQRRTGLTHYHEMCVQCHGAPGLERGELGQGLRPRPPHLYQARQRDTREDFWVLRHGIRMTGMPAFGVTHQEDELWAIAAFLQELSELSPEQYAQRVRQAGLELQPSGHSHAGGGQGHQDMGGSTLEDHPHPEGGHSGGEHEEGQGESGGEEGHDHAGHEHG